MNAIKKHRRIAALALVVCLLLPAFAGAREGTAGRAGAFLRMGLGARAKAMGGAHVAAVNDGFGAFYNPAVLADLDGRFLTTSKMFLSLDRSFSVLGYAQKLPPTAGVSFLWINAGIDNIEQRDFSGAPLGNINHSENALYFSFANRVSSWVSVGVTGKFLYQQLFDVTGKGFGADVGVLITPMQRLRIGLQVKDLRSSFEWNTDDIYERGSSINNSFPVTLRGGIAWEWPAYRTIFTADIDKEKHGDTLLHVGVEHALAQRYRLRAGVDGGDITGGFGLRFRVFGMESVLDYGIVNVDHDPEPSQIISWMLQF